jgi:hypothetical protein
VLRTYEFPPRYLLIIFSSPQAHDKQRACVIRFFEAAGFKKSNIPAGQNGVIAVEERA